MKECEMENDLDYRRIDSYNKSIRYNFAFMKETKSMDDLYAKSIKLGGDKGFLIPLCELHKDDDELIEMLTQWRKDNSFAYPTRFRVTFEGTARWLKNAVLGVEDRILFLVVNQHGKPIGHMGFANAINDGCHLETDNIIRGVTQDSKGIMSFGMQSLLCWAETTLWPEDIFLRVLDDNPKAIDFYKKLGFIQDSVLPLRRKVEGESESFIPVPADDKAAPDKNFIRMVYRPERNAGHELILTAGPSICAREASYALDAARFGWNHHWADYIKKFESSFAEYLGVKHALSFSCCTGALHLALLSLGIGPGDEVIVPDLTWVATANSVLYTGATPVFADIDPQTWCISHASIQACITERTKAIMPVHLYGHPAPMDKIMALAREHELFVVEDAAPAIGAEHKGQKTGTFGDLAAFSFQGAKLVVAGEGGMLVTNNEELYQRVYSLWDQGRQPGTFWIQKNGWKYKMSNIQAAIGLGQLEHVDELIEAKRRIFRWYDNGLKGIPYLRLCYEPKGTRSIYWMSSILLDSKSPIGRDQLRDELRKRNIDTRNVFPAISQYPIWPKKQSPQPMAKMVGDHAINLPSGVCLREEQVAYVCGCLKNILTS